MWTRQHKKRNTGALIVPAITVVFLSYFGFHAFHGEYGIYSKYGLEERVAALQINLAPLLRALYHATVDLLQLDAIDGADFEARLAAGAVVGVDDRQLLRNFLAWSFFGHGGVEG